MKRHLQRLQPRRAVDVAAVAAAALVLAAVGLVEMAWLPFFVLATSAAATPGRCLLRWRRSGAPRS